MTWKFVNFQKFFFTFNFFNSAYFTYKNILENYCVQCYFHQRKYFQIYQIDRTLLAEKKIVAPYVVYIKSEFYPFSLS